ncbi:MAG: GAF domain-containing protein [Heliomarina sp.]|uniref:GAF domain-containing protein n=1 Tax=Heliomarina sp. TaxID=2917556 RepID=UPI00405965E5
MVRKLFDCPTALVSLVEEDEQWFKARDGFNISRTPRDYSLCAHTIMSDESLVICDTLSDPKFSNYPVAINDPNIRFYVGSPINSFIRLQDWKFMWYRLRRSRTTFR